MPSEDVMKKFGKGTLRSGSKKGPVVTNPRQAKAIASSERRAEKKHGGRYPEHTASRRGGRDAQHASARGSKARMKRLEGMEL